MKPTIPTNVSIPSVHIVATGETKITDRNIIQPNYTIDLLRNENELQLDMKWQETVDNMTGFTDEEKQLMKEGGAKAWHALADSNSIAEARSDYVKNHKSTIRESVMYKAFTSGENKENQESIVDDAVISAAFKIAKIKGRTKPTRADYLKAEEQVFSDFNISQNSALYQLFGGAKFTQEKFAMGGPTTANKPIIVGEEGPEVFVPKQDGSIVSNPATKGGYNWEDAIIDNSEMLKKIKDTNGRAEAVKALKKFRPDLYV